MTDLEMTKLCAEALGVSADDPAWIRKFDPLHDDAQAMALVKKFGLVILHEHRDNKTWNVSYNWEYPGVSNDDLNRAIVECVAKMQAAK